MSIFVDVKVLMAKCYKTASLFKEYATVGATLGEEALKIIKERTPKKTGVTAESWALTVKKHFYGVSWKIASVGREDIVRHLEYGTKPHIIQAAEGSVLAFEVDGKTVFTTVVHHPGTKPLGFVRGVQELYGGKGTELSSSLLNSIRSLWK